MQEFPHKLIGDLKQKILQKISDSFWFGLILRRILLDFFFTGKSFVKFFPIFKLESDFFPQFLSKIRKLEICAHLNIVNFKFAKFQRI